MEKDVFENRIKLAGIYEKNIDPETSKNIFWKSGYGKNDGFRILLKGKLRHPKEIEYKEGMWIYYKVNKLQIGIGNITFDLLKLTPPEWRVSAVHTPSIQTTSPEQLIFLAHQLNIDPNNQELIIGPFFLLKNNQTTAKILLWNFLMARALSEAGEPVNILASQNLREMVEKKRDIILKNIQNNDTNTKNLLEIGLKPFTL